jgi:hypothetical protein
MCTDGVLVNPLGRSRPLKVFQTTNELQKWLDRPRRQDVDQDGKDPDAG